LVKTRRDGRAREGGRRQESHQSKEGREGATSIVPVRESWVVPKTSSYVGKRFGVKRVGKRQNEKSGREKPDQSP